jgi:predicted ATP-binding protein involved in virulence
MLGYIKDMHIDTLKLTNFRCYANSEFRFDPSFNLIVGENGAGKTSLLHGLAVAAGSWFLGVRGYDSRHIQEEDIRREVGFQGDALVVTKKYPVTVETSGVIMEQNLRWSRSISGEGGKTTQKDARSLKSVAEKAVKQVGDQAKIALPLVSFYGAGRLWVPAKDMKGESDSKERLENKRLDGYLFSLDPRINFADLFRWLKDERYVALERGKDRFGYAAVKQAMKACLEDCLTIDYNVTEKALIVETSARGRLPFDLLSDGQKSMLALAADIAFKSALLNPHLEDQVLAETPGIVFIDELDLHIHPRWQRHLVKDLKNIFKKIQFFATTHSPQVIGETPAEQIIKLNRDGSWEHPTQTLGLSSNQVLYEIMGAEVINEEKKRKFNEIRDTSSMHGTWKSAVANVIMLAGKTTNDAGI